MKNIITAGMVAALLLTACNKNDQVAEKSLEQQKMEFQQRQIEIEKQRLAIEKEKIAYETQRKADSIETVTKARQASAAPVRTNVVRETVYVNNTPSGNTGNASSGTTQAQQKQGMSKAAKGAIIGTVGGAAAGAIINKRDRGTGAVIGGIVGGATGYTIGRAQDRKDGRVQ